MASAEGFLERVAGDIQKSAYETLNVLWDIWLPCFNKEMKEKYAQKVSGHVQDLFNDIIEEARESREKLTNEVEALLKEINNVSNLLSEKLPEDIVNVKTVWFESIDIFKTKLASYNEILGSRQEEINQLTEAEECICNDLGVQKKGLSSLPLPSGAEIDQFKEYLNSLRDERDLRQMDLERMRKEIIPLFNELGVKPSLEFEFRVVNGNPIRVTKSNMNRMMDIKQGLIDKIEEAKATALELREKLNHLWERLEESPAVRSDFQIKHPGYCTNVILALRNETSRCEDLKRQNIKTFVDKVKVELVALWDKCKYSEEQRNTFHPFSSECYTEDLLTLLEMQVRKLENFYRDNQTIFDLLNKRQEYWDQKIELEAKANEPNRYNNRGGQLLKEEKERKRLAIHLPQLESKLINLVRHYKSITNSDFIVNGKEVESLIEEAWEQFQQNKHFKLCERKRAKSTSPCLLSHNTGSSQGKFSSGKTRKLSPGISTKKRSPSRITPDAKRRLYVLTPKNVNSPVPVASASPSTKSKPKMVTVSVNGIKRRRAKRRSNLMRNQSKSAVDPAGSPRKETLSTTYTDFEGHLVPRDHLRSSVVPAKPKRKTVKSNVKVVLTPATPARPARANGKQLPSATPQARSMPHSDHPGRTRTQIRVTPAQCNVATSVVRQNTFLIAKKHPETSVSEDLN